MVSGLHCGQQLKLLQKVVHVQVILTQKKGHRSLENRELVNFYIAIFQAKIKLLNLVRQLF